MGTLHCALENGADLYVNERQKIKHYRARSTEERRVPNRYFLLARCIRKLALYSDVIHSFYSTAFWCIVNVRLVRG